MKKINPDIKTVFVSGGEDFYGFDKYFARYIDYMFAVSEDNRKIIKKRYKRKVKILHNGVNLENFHFSEIERKRIRKKYKFDDRFVLISIGRVVPLKGFQLVIVALSKLSNDYIYVLIGDGEYLEDLRKLAEKKNVMDKILFLGEKQNNELYKYLSAADVFVQPTIGNEAFGITLLEAMACNLPVIASNNGGMKEIVKNAQNGFLFKNGDVNDLIGKILQIRKTKFIHMREYVKKYFTWQKTVETLIKQIKVD